MTIQDLVIEITMEKFETAYFVVKEELPITKYKAILLLEEKHGVELGKAYCNDSSGGVIIDYIAESIAQDLQHKLKKSKFYSTFLDGSTDANIVEKEAFFVVTLDPTPPNIVTKLK